MIIQSGGGTITDTIDGVGTWNAGETHTIPGVSVTIALLAHQGGWDEFLLVAVPIVVIIAVLAVAKRRVDRMSDTPGDR